MKYYNNKYIITSALVVVCLFASLLLKKTHHPKHDRMQTGFYIWQGFWTDAVKQAVQRASNRSDRFFIIAAEIQEESGQLSAHKKKPHWQTLAETNQPITPVIRMDASLGKYMIDGKQRGLLALVRKTVLDCINDAQTEGVNLSDVQFDYDCPTSKIKDYTTFIQSFLLMFPSISLSITALPTWLGDENFKTLVKPLSYYVLQVHSLEKPETIEDEVSIYQSFIERNYLRQTESIGVPYYLALPTYGYQFVFDRQKKFTALFAETLQPSLKPGYLSRRIMADPIPIINDLRELNEHPPRHCLGTIWFRLPVDTDRLNWAWPTLEAVIAYREPAIELRTETRNPSPNLYEIWVTNTGEQNIFDSIRFDVTIQDRTILAYEVANEFRQGETAHRLIGPAPSVNEPKLAVWYRLDQPAASDKHPITVSPVEVVP